MTSTSVLTTNGKKLILNRAYKTTPTYTIPARFRVGINQTTVTQATTTLVFNVPITGTESVDSCDATTSWTGGTDSVVALNTTTFVEGTGSLSLSKTGTAGTVFSMSKTTTSRDFTSKQVHTRLYILALADLVASGTAVVIRFGSDSSNYYSYNVDLSVLSTGWNTIVFTSATATGTTGSPVIAACDYYEIRLNTDLAADTVAANRILIDDLKVISTDDLYKTLDVGYPSVDESTLEVTMRATLSAADANGYFINGFLVENTDATPLVSGADNFSGESKTSIDEVIFIVKERII